MTVRPQGRLYLKDNLMERKPIFGTTVGRRELLAGTNDAAIKVVEAAAQRSAARLMSESTPR